jgi:hypothetical protein
VCDAPVALDIVRGVDEFTGPAAIPIRDLHHEVARRNVGVRSLESAHRENRVDDGFHVDLAPVVEHRLTPLLGVADGSRVGCRHHETARLDADEHARASTKAAPLQPMARHAEVRHRLAARCAHRRDRVDAHVSAARRGVLLRPRLLRRFRVMLAQVALRTLDSGMRAIAGRCSRNSR